MMEQNIEKEIITIHLDYLPRINYAIIHSGIEACNSLVIENRDQKDWNHITVSISGEYFEKRSCRFDYLRQGASLQASSVSIVPDIRLISDITEAVGTSFRLTVEEENGLLSEKEYPIELLAYDEWAGSNVMPEHLAAFVVPNNPQLPRIKINAAKHLEKWTGSSAFDEYQTQDRNRVRAQVAAIYEALRAEGIVYSAPPASFEKNGQRIRLADKVLSEKTGTCIDTSLLIASCLEEASIYPIIVILNGHAMVGAWLTPTVFPQMVCDDSSYLLKEMADGNNNLVLLESTCITASEKVSFEEAVLRARQKMSEESSFMYFVDIHRCRLGHIRPIPQRILKDGAWTFVSEGIEHENATNGVSELSHYDLRLDDDGKPATKQIIWERKLLDFSLRNNLLNTRLGRKVVPFISFNIEHLEDHLQNGEDYYITETPGDKIDANEDGMYDSIHQALAYQELVSELIGDHKIASYLTTTELQNALKHLYRTARTSIEENGANSLFLALGMLRWFETEKSIQPRFAPILLMPVDIIRKSGNKYVIRKRDEDIILNTTLVELLKQSFKISLDILKELPKDESGVDVKKIFTIFRRAIKEQKRWNVVEESMLGLFSFNKFVMWNDIHSNAGKLRENTVVASLIENENRQEQTDELIDARTIDKEKAPLDFAIPLDVDSSQMEAIVESGRGKSFILHGPPGTGKSQTITNMIANALYQGKRVLFVAEKMAALSVVQSRLEKLQLAPFCLELHSNKATKKHFLEQMEQVLNVKKISSPEDYSHSSGELYKERTELIRYMESLHRRGANGYSLYDCIMAYFSITDDEITEALPGLERMDKNYVETCRSLIGEINSIIPVSGSPYGHPLKGLYLRDNRSETIERVKVLLEDAQKSFGQYRERLDKVEKASSFPITGENDVAWLKSVTEVVKETELMNGQLLALGMDDLLRASYNQHIEQGKKYAQQKQKLLADYSEDILEMNAQETRSQWEEIQDKWFLPRYFAKKKFLKSLSRYGRITEDNLEDVTSSVREYQSLHQSYDRIPTSFREAFGALAINQQEQWERMEKLMSLVPQLTDAISTYARQHERTYGDCAKAFMETADGQWSLFKKELHSAASPLFETYDHLESVREELTAWSGHTYHINDIETHVAQWLAHYQQAKDWYFWIDKKREISELGLQVVISKIEDEGLAPSQAVNGVLKGLFHQTINHAIDEDEQLRMFNGQLFRQNIGKYKEHTKRFQELSKRELYHRLASRVPSSAGTAEGSEIGRLKRSIANGGRGNSIRSLIDSMPTLLPRLCPCMLMSPISVAQYIDLNTEKFDLVIFDEASQMPTSEAVGAIARGKALVVVGDRKQMPPTSFFTTTQVDEEEADIDDLESILDDCISLSLPEYKLQWHYRSKHESLIAFSNSQYYNNELFTFPSVDDQLARVKLIPINGIYDKGRTRSNPAEAKAIVEEIISRLSDPVLNQSSIGVVSFSKVQGNLIEDELTEQLDKHPELKDIAFNGKEPVFIKNLENVQGDERDVILFSVGYGADKYGKVSMNFGPLNNAGGERRLNVAVSRARKEMLVYSTLSSSQIDLKRSHAKGVEGLKAFLEYAESGRLPMLAETVRHTESNMMVMQICEALQSHGYPTNTFVGRSNFKVDIAVSTKEAPGQYILGILCDGKNYFETKTTRDREIVQPSVLEMLNWQVMRVYSIDWFEHPDETVRQILDTIDNIQSDSLQKKTEEGVKSYVFNVEKTKADNAARPAISNENRRDYQEAVVASGSIQPDNFDPFAKKTMKLIQGILETEQPVNENYLCKMMAKYLGFGHAGPNIQKSVAYAYSKGIIYKDPRAIGGSSCLWLDKKSAADYHSYRSPSPRSINEIPYPEIANAIRELIREEYSLPKSSIPTLAAKKLGFSGAGKNIQTTMNEVLDYMLDNNILAEKGEIICLQEDGM